MKPAGHPEQASLNQCQLIAQNLYTAHAQLMLAIRFLCNVNDTWLVFVPSWPYADARSVTSGMSPALHYSSYSSSILHLNEKEVFYLPTINMAMMPQISEEPPQQLANTNLKDLLF